MNTLTLQGPDDSSVTPLSNIFIDQYMPGASGDFVKIYLYFLRYSACPGAGVSLASAADTFCMTESDIVRALKYWEREGLILLGYTDRLITSIRLLPITDTFCQPQTEMPVPQAAAGPSESEPAITIAEPIMPDTAGPTNMYNGTPAYSASDLEHFKKDKGQQLFFVIEQYLGKPLGSTDINIIVFIGEQLGFSADLIEYLFEYCVSNDHYSIHYIEKTAIAWAKDGIDTVAKAKARTTYYNKTCFEILRAFGITNRNPAPGEMEHIRRWTREYGFPMPVILEACRRTIEATHQPSFAYAQGILERWYKNNVGSLDDVKRLDNIHEKEKAEAAKRQESTSTADGSKDHNSRKTNRFHNFDQRSYDYDQLEQVLWGRSMKNNDGR